MGWWERRVVAAGFDRALDVPAIHAERARTLARAHGTILEVGVGTGLNFPNYPSAARRLSVLSREGPLDERANQRARAAGRVLDHVRGDAARLPFLDAQFDTVVCTFVLCSLQDPAAAIAEFERVLKPGGQLLFLEHVRAPGGARRFLQTIANPFSRALRCGCQLTRDTASLLRSSTLAIEELEEYDLAALDALHRRVIRGVAVAGSA